MGFPNNNAERFLRLLVCLTRSSSAILFLRTAAGNVICHIAFSLHGVTFRDVPRQQCHDVQDAVERKVPEQVCQDRQVTSYRDSQECNTISKQVCRNVPKQECRDVPEVVEKLVPVQVCNT